MTGYLERTLAADPPPGPAPTDAPAWLYLLPQLPPRTFRALGEVPAHAIAALEAGGSRADRGATDPIDLIVAGPGASTQDLVAATDRSPGAAVVLLPGAPRAGRGADVRRLTTADHRTEPTGADDGGSRRVGLAFPTPSTEASVAARAIARTRRVVGRDVPAAGDGGPWRVGDRPAAPHDVVVLQPAQVRRHLAPASVRAAGLGDGPGWSVVGLEHGTPPSAVFLPVDVPGTVVKVAASGHAGEGLRREAAVLEHLTAHAPLRGLVPASAGTVAHGAVTIATQTLLAGPTFREQATGTPVGPLLGAGLDALHRLAIATARRDVRDLRGPLDALVERYATRFGAGDVTRRLRQDVDVVVHAAPPAVVVHGDPSPDHLLVQEAGAIAFVGWQWSEPLGPPVWDLLGLLLADVEMWLARRGRASTPRVVARHLFARGDWHHRLERELARASGELRFAPVASWSLARLGLAALALRDAPTVGHDGPDASRHAAILAEVAHGLDDSAGAAVP